MLTVVHNSKHTGIASPDQALPCRRETAASIVVGTLIGGGSGLARIQQPASAQMSAAEIEAKLLRQVDQDGALADSGDFAAANGWDHMAVVGVIKSLEAAEMITTQVIRRRGLLLCGVRRERSCFGARRHAAPAAATAAATPAAPAAASPAAVLPQQQQHNTILSTILHT